MERQCSFFTVALDMAAELQKQGTCGYGACSVKTFSNSDMQYQGVDEHITAQTSCPELSDPLKTSYQSVLSDSFTHLIWFWFWASLSPTNKTSLAETFCKQSVFMGINHNASKKLLNFNTAVDLEVLLTKYQPG